jgi:hypothetical protein
VLVLVLVEGKNGELIWLWEALTSCCVLPGDLCALARDIHRYGMGKKVGLSQLQQTSELEISEQANRSM